MKTGHWIVLLVVVAWISFLLGYSISAITIVERPPTGPGIEQPAAGYGEAGGYR